MRGSLSRHFGVPFISKDAERACSGLERMIEQGSPVAPYIRSGWADNQKLLAAGAPGGVALSMRRAA
jgi:hypothetical protein